MKNSCVLLNGPIRYDGRVIRTIQTLSAHARVDLFYLNGIEDDNKIFNENVRLYSLKHAADSFYTKLVRHLFFYLEFNFFVKEVLKTNVRYDIVYANDLPTLYPAVKLKKKLEARLVYDSHEIYLETLNQFFPTEGNIIKLLLFKSLLSLMRFVGGVAENRLLESVDTFITVNQSLADYFKRKYGVDQVDVMMSCPSKQQRRLEPEVDFRELYGWKDEDTVMVYQGVINKGRGYETLLLAMTKVDERVKLVIIGDGFLKNTLDELVATLKLEKRVKFFGRVHQDRLLRYTVAADFGINFVGLEEYNLSKKLASPNKLFEYMHAGIPVLASSTIENRRVFTEYDIGVLTENDVTKVAEAIMELVTSDKVEQFKHNSLRAAEKYNWQEQSGVLVKLLE